jgi:hypothetical protein
MFMLTLHFKGTCCIVDGRESDPFVKRVVMPRDTQYAALGEEPHVPYVEIEAGDLGDATIVPAKSYTRGEGALAVAYHRFELDAERVSIANVVPGNSLIVVPTLDERIPKMTLVCPDCPPRPRGECLDAVPPPDLVAACFDIHTGYLNTGLLELQPTTFDEGSNWPSRRLAHWVRLDVPVQGDSASIVLEKYDGSGMRTIPLKPDASTVTIGSGRDEDIEDRATGSNRREHFDLYYSLGENLPAFRPRPTIPMSAIRACAPTTWP